MDIRELKIKSVAELKHLLEDSKNKLEELRFKAVQKQLKNIREVRIVKKDISRILTLLDQKQKECKVDKK